MRQIFLKAFSLWLPAAEASVTRNVSTLSCPTHPCKMLMSVTDQRVCKPLTHSAGQRRSLLLVPNDKLVFTKLLAAPRHPWQPSPVFPSPPQPRSGALYFPASAAANCSSELGDCRRYKCVKQRLTARVECVAVRRNLQAPSPLRQPPCRCR